MAFVSVGRKLFGSQRTAYEYINFMQFLPNATTLREVLLALMLLLPSLTTPSCRAAINEPCNTQGAIVLVAFVSCFVTVCIINITGKR